MKNVLFVCVENSCRSQLAEAFGHLHKGESFKIYSAGSNPSGQVNKKAITVMAELGYDLSMHNSKSLQRVPDIEYDGIITMGCGDNCSHIKGHLREDWNLPDPKHMPLDAFREIRNTIEENVKGLLQRLSVR